MKFLKQKFPPQHNAKMGHTFYQEFLLSVLQLPKKKKKKKIDYKTSKLVKRQAATPHD